MLVTLCDTSVTVSDTEYHKEFHTDLFYGVFQQCGSKLHLAGTNTILLLQRLCTDQQCNIISSILVEV